MNTKSIPVPFIKEKHTDNVDTCFVSAYPPFSSDLYSLNYKTFEHPFSYGRLLCTLNEEYYQSELYISFLQRQGYFDKNSLVIKALM